MKLSKFATVLAAGVLTAGIGAAQAQDDPVLRIAVEGEYPPFSEVDPNGNLIGFDVEIANALCEKMNRKCEMLQNGWDTIIPALLENKYDAIVASMSITEERKKRVDFTQKYYSTPARFVAKDGADFEPTTDGLEGKVVGLQKGTTHQCYMEKHFPDVELRLYDDQTDVFRDLANGRLDGQLSDSILALEGFLNTDDGEGYAFLGGDQYDKECYGEGEGIAVRKEDDDLKGAFNAAIKAIRADGTYDAINAKYFEFDIYGAPTN